MLAATIAFTALIALGLMARPADAATFTVTTTADVVDPSDGVLSLREAIDEANLSGGDDVIVLPAGTHTLSLSSGRNNDNSGGDLDHLDRGGLTIVGAGLDVTIIDAAGLSDRILDMRSGDLVIEDLTLTNGATGGGGGAVRAAGSLAATRVGVSGNAATSGGGGGLRVVGDVSIRSSRLDGNSASNNGGGVRGEAALTIADSTLSGNTAGNSGGAAYAPGATDLARTTFASNSAASHGGGLWAGNASLAITESTFSANRAGGNGGAIRAQNPATTITGSTFTGNAAVNNGGAIRQRNGSLAVTNSTFDADSATAGGAIWLRNAVAELTHVTIADSASSTEGSVRAAGGSTVTFASTLIAPASGSACTLAGTVASAGSNGDTDGSCLLTRPNDQSGTAVPDLLPLSNNAGLTMTRRPAASSSVIDAATCAAGADQRGIARPEGAQCEIGAVELRIPVPQPDAATTPQDVAVNVDVVANDTVNDGHVDPSSAATTSGPSNGSTTDVGDGTITYTPAPGWSGTDSFTYELCGTGESSCNTAVVTVTVTAAPTTTTTSTTTSTTVAPTSTHDRSDHRRTDDRSPDHRRPDNGTDPGQGRHPGPGRRPPGSGRHAHQPPGDRHDQRRTVHPSGRRIPLPRYVGDDRASQHAASAQSRRVPPAGRRLDPGLNPLGV